MICVIGARGRLGTALCGRVQADQLIAPSREVYAHWSEPGGMAQMHLFFQENSHIQQVYVTAGILDPAAAEDQHAAVNYLLPRNIILAAEKYDFAVTTVGTIMESFPQADNAYIRSKRNIGRFVSERAEEGWPVTHAQVHTLYGVGQPSAFMFLGQMLDALIRDEIFSMSAGTQLREYHHVLDDVEALLALAVAGYKGCIALSHGDPVRLVSLARYIFNYFGKESLLRVGELSSPQGENFEQHYIRPAPLQELNFRNTLPGVAKYMSDCLANE
jgi:nucleoside-diphosphate-sugar epimerase